MEQFPLVARLRHVLWTMTPRLFFYHRIYPNRISYHLHYNAESLTQLPLYLYNSYKMSWLNFPCICAGCRGLTSLIFVTEWFQLWNIFLKFRTFFWQIVNEWNSCLVLRILNLFHFKKKKNKYWSNLRCIFKFLVSMVTFVLQDLNFCKTFQYDVERRIQYS